MSDLQQKQRSAIATLDYYLRRIRDESMLFYGVEGPVVLVVPSDQPHSHRSHGLYFPKEEVICDRVATVSSSPRPYIVTSQGVLARPVVVNSWKFWSKKRTSTLYVAVSSRQLQELDVDLIEAIIKSLCTVVRDDDPC